MTEQKRPFLEGFSTLSIPLLNEVGKSAWPERFDEAKIRDIRARVGKHRFATQMMLKTPDEKQAFFNLDLLNFYADSLESRHANQLTAFSIAGQKIVSGSAFWDPALGRKTGDNSVLACVFQDEAGLYYLHKLRYLMVERTANSAQEQCDAILKENSLKKLVVETNGIGGFLPEIFRSRCRVNRYPVAIRPLHNRQAKNERILQTLDPLLSSGFLKIHQSVKNTPLLEEMRQWHPDSKHSHDDGLDAMSGAIIAEPIRMGKSFIV